MSRRNQEEKEAKRRNKGVLGTIMRASAGALACLGSSANDGRI
jgi:hypothetical protein